MTSWKRQSITDTEIEKDILTGIITNANYLKQIQQIYSPELFQISYAKIIMRWCFAYYEKYNKAINQDIQELYNAYSNDKNTNEAQVELIGKFLSDLSNKYAEKTNVEYHIDKAEQYFRKRKIEILRDNLGLLLLDNRVDECEKEIGDYKRPIKEKTSGVDIIHGNITDFLNEEEEQLFQFPGELGEMISPFYREDFVAIAAPMKRGKTLWLTELGLKALFRGFKVVQYSFESSTHRMIKRIYQNLLGESSSGKEIEFPYFEDNRIEYKTLIKKGVTQKAIIKKKKQLEKMLQAGFWLKCCPTYSMNVDDIRIDLDNLIHFNNFIPDVIIIDYADILAPEKNSSREERHKLNNTWLALRGLAQERKALVITATQLTRATFNRDANEEDIAEDIRKLAHVTHMIALNQSKEDKKKQVMRINMLAVRDQEFHVGDEIVVLECKQIGKPFIDARWKKNVIL